MAKIEPRCMRAPWSNSVEIAFIHDTGKGFSLGKVVFTAADEGQMIEPAIELKPKEAQLLMDELWSCGIRPTEGSGSAGSLAATERHLADMKKIAFKLLKVE